MLASSLLFILVSFPLLSYATPPEANISIYPITSNPPYFSDPFPVPDQDPKNVRIAGTTQKFLECDNFLQPECASEHSITFDNGTLAKAADDSGAKICSPAGIHPFQSDPGNQSAWHAVLTLHVQKKGSECKGISGWSVIVHASPKRSATSDGMPTDWIGDKLLIGSFSEAVDANYDGKYFKTPEGQLYLVYSKQASPKPQKRDGIAAVKMDDPTAISAGAKPAFLLLPDDDFNSEDYDAGNPAFKLIETGNILAHNGKFIIAYSAAAFAQNTYKVGIAFSDAFGGPYRKVLKDNLDSLWNSTGKQEVYYLLQSDQDHAGWHYVGNQVKAPGVPTVAQIGPNSSWVLIFAGYAASDAPMKGGKFLASHRRPFFINLNVNVPQGGSVQQANNTELQGWITPVH